MDKTARLLLTEYRRRSSAHVKATLQVNADDCIPVILCHFMKNNVAQYTSIVYDDIEATEVIEGGLYEFARLFHIRDIRAICNGFAATGADFLDDPFGRALTVALAREGDAEIVHDDLRTGGRESQRVSAADSPAGARDDDDAAVANSGHIRFPSGERRLAQALDDGDVGLAAAFAHGLQAEAPADAVEFKEERRH